jgi:hypothetical protein
MPVGFLTQAERDRLNRFPDHIPHDDLIAFLAYPSKIVFL